MKLSAVVEIISAILVLLFVYAGITKLIDHHAFLFQLSISPNTRTYGSRLSWALPAVELALVGLLLIKRSRLVGLYGAVVLFGIYLYAILNFKYFVPWISGGILTRISYKPHLILDLIFFVLALAGAAIATRLAVHRMHDLKYKPALT
jgi:hypothetical protein